MSRDAMTRTLSVLALLAFGLGIWGGHIIASRSGPSDARSFEALSRWLHGERVLTIMNRKAADVAAIIKQAYADRLIVSNPAHLLSGMTVDVDSRSNSIAIVAPNGLFQEVAGFVKKLDDEK